MLKDRSTVIYEEVAKMLRDAYDSGETNRELVHAMRQLTSDPYFELLPKYFGEGLTIERLAEEYDVEVSTITRNKKRLCLKIYELMEGLG